MGWEWERIEKRLKECTKEKTSLLKYGHRVRGRGNLMVISWVARGVVFAFDPSAWHFYVEEVPLGISCQ